MKVIANTTAISNFASVGRLDLLQALLGEVFISSGVYDEIQDGLQEGYDFYSDLEGLIYPFTEEGWLRLTSLEGEDELKLYGSLPKQLHWGEASCLAIARHRGWALLTDDKKARKVAREWGITLSGTLGVLVQAVQAGLLTVDEGNGLLREMIAKGYRSPYADLRLLLVNE